jgi:hypothetical protein
MIDSITLICPVKIDPASFRVESWEQRITQNGRHFTNLYVSEVDALSMQLAYDVGRGDLVLGHGSMPRAYQGHNARLLNEQQIIQTVDRLDAAMREILKYVSVPHAEVPTLWDWSVRKVDIAFDFKPASISGATAWKAFDSLQPTRKMIAFKAPTTVYFRAASRRFRNELRIYDKHAEALKTYSPEIAALAKNVIRLELVLRDQETVRRTLHIEDNCLCAVAERHRVYEALRRKLGQLHVAEGLSTVSVGLEHLTDLFGHRRGRDLCTYRQDRMAWTDAQIAKRYGVTLETVRGYSCDLRKAGMFPAAVPVSGVFEELLSALDAAINEAPESAAALAVEPAPAA